MGQKVRIAAATTTCDPREDGAAAGFARIAVALFAALWLASFAVPAAAQSPASPTVVAARGDVSQVVSALGNLQPRDYVDVGLQVSGQIKALHVAIGDEVEAGSLLAEIDPAVLVAKVEGGRAQLAAQRALRVERQAQRKLAELQWQRQQRLMRSNATSEEALQNAEAQAASALAQIDQLDAQIRQTESTLRADETTLGYARVVAPMSGTIVQLQARRGQTLNAVQQAPTLMRIADLSTMTVSAQVSEADVPKLRVGMPAYFQILGVPGRRWSGTLRQIQPMPEVVNNVVLYTVLFDVDNAGGELMIQMTAQVFFILAEARDVVTLPVAALQPAPAAAGRAARLVEVLDSAGERSERKVEVGVIGRTHAEIRSGLTAGERVALPRPPALPGRGPSFGPRR